MRASRIVLFAISAVLIAAVRDSHAEAWKSFDSKVERFRIRYPASWNLLKFWDGDSRSPEYLDIINFPESDALKGVFLTSAGAEIRVGRAPSDVRTIEAWIARGAGLVEKVDQREIRIRTPAKHGCTRLVRLVTRGETGPDGGSFLYTEYYCLADSALYVIALHHWEDNPDREKLQAITLKMALSLRSWSDSAKRADDR